MGGAQEMASIFSSLDEQIRKNNIEFTFATYPKNHPFSEASYKLYFAGTGLLSQTPGKILNFCNMEAARLFGYAEGELEGLSSLVLVPERFRHERDRMFEEVLQTGKPVFRHETLRLKKDGEEIKIIATVFRYEYGPGIYSIAATVEI